MQTLPVISIIGPLQTDRELAKQRRERKRDNGNQHGRNQRPYKSCMPFPTPDFADEFDRISSCRFDQRAGRKRYRFRMEDAAAQLKERNEEKKLQGID